MNQPTVNLDRRQFLRQSFAFSAIAAMGSRSLLAAPPDPAATHILMFGDWGRDDDLTEVATHKVHFP